VSPPAATLDSVWTTYGNPEIELLPPTAEEILGGTAALLAQRGDNEAAALLVDVHGLAIATTDEVVRDPRSSLDDGKALIAIVDVDEHLVLRFLGPSPRRLPSRAWGALPS
jgi:hypothetical protein